MYSIRIQSAYSRNYQSHNISSQAAFPAPHTTTTRKYYSDNIITKPYCTENIITQYYKGHYYKTQHHKHTS